MGLFKSIKDMKDMAHEAPEAINQARQLGANAQAQAAAQQAAMSGMTFPGMPGMPGMPAAPVAPMAGPVGPDFEAINGVSIELYADISKSLATVGYDQTRLPALAAAKGVAPGDWDAAMTGWNARMQANPAVASRFNALYTGR